MATIPLIGRVSSYSGSGSSQSSSGNLSGGKVAALTIGTIFAVGLVCLLLFCPQLVFARLKKSRSRTRPLIDGEVPSKDRPPPRPGRVSGNDRAGNGADDAGSRRRRAEGVQGGSTRLHSDHVVVSRRSENPVVINNNIYLQSLPALNSSRNQNHASPGVRVLQNAQGSSGTRNPLFGLSPNGSIPPPRRRNGESLASPPMATTSEQTAASNFWNVADWARGVAPGQLPRSPARGSAGSPVCPRHQDSVRPRGESFTRERELDVPGAFPEAYDALDRFQLVTAPARTHAPRVPSHGDNGFWLQEARESRWKRQEAEDRREKQERADRRERQEREERRERERYEREEKRERDRLEREDGRERQEREERREMQEREDRRERQNELRRWRYVY